jgi:pimeloyl-ACP methyl ester carboxylesterase
MAHNQHATPSRTDYTVHKGGVSLAVYRKQLHPVSGEARPVLFLVHGSSNSALSSFDLAVPGAGEYSTMHVFAGLGFDVWTMDHENYGRSSRTSGNSDIASGVADLVAATELVIRETGQKRMHFMGESSGALRAAAFAMVRPERVDRLVLNAFTYTGRDSPTLEKRAEQLDYFRTHNRRLRDREMIRSIFTREPSRDERPGRRRGAGRCRARLRRSGADRNLPGHDGKPPGRRSARGAGAGHDRARRA